MLIMLLHQPHTHTSALPLTRGHAGKGLGGGCGAKV